MSSMPKATKFNFTHETLEAALSVANEMGVLIPGPEDNDVPRSLRSMEMETILLRAWHTQEHAGDYNVSDMRSQIRSLHLDIERLEKEYDERISKLRKLEGDIRTLLEATVIQLERERTARAWNRLAERVGMDDPE